ncbi:MAG TPA: hypothetical protein VNT26_06700 [Candidatus Sulfotelmatobacter sp.]|nr:hypothetical protein [Candidatus Sulfotelmatobacter sp.]
MWTATKAKFPPLVAWDIDDALGDCQAALVRWNNQNGYPPICTEDLFDFNLSLVFRCSDEETRTRLGLFMRHDLFRNMEPVAAARQTVEHIGQHARQIAVTGRPGYTLDFTQAWLERHFPNCFSDLVTLDSTPLNHPTSLKGAECARRGVSVIIEDSPFHAQSCLAHGIKVVMPTKRWNRSFQAAGVTQIASLENCAPVVMEHLR